MNMCMTKCTIKVEKFGLMSSKNIYLDMPFDDRSRMSTCSEMNKSTLCIHSWSYPNLISPTVVCDWNFTASFQKMFQLFWPPSQMNLETNDTSFERPYIGCLESAKRLGVASSWGWPCPLKWKSTTFTRTRLEPFIT